MIRNVIFDIGGVLVNVDFNGAFRRLTGADDEKIQRLRHALFDNGTWDEVDRGVLSDMQLVESFVAKEPELREDIQKIWNNLGEIINQYDYAVPWVESLKERGYGVYFLSNWSYHLRKVGQADMTFIPHFDGGIYSCDVKLLKPDKRIYELICEKYGLEISECVFMDDNALNVKGAIDAGMRGIVVDDYDRVRDELEKLLMEK